MSSLSGASTSSGSSIVSSALGRKWLGRWQTPALMLLSIVCALLVLYLWRESRVQRQVQAQVQELAEQRYNYPDSSVVKDALVSLERAQQNSASPQVVQAVVERLNNVDSAVQLFMGYMAHQHEQLQKASVEPVPEPEQEQEQEPEYESEQPTPEPVDVGTADTQQNAEQDADQSTQQDTQQDIQQDITDEISQDDPVHMDEPIDLVLNDSPVQPVPEHEPESEVAAAAVAVAVHFEEPQPEPQPDTETETPPATRGRPRKTPKSSGKRIKPSKTAAATATDELVAEPVL